jgi:hypothetical protein
MQAERLLSFFVCRNTDDLAASGERSVPRSTTQNYGTFTELFEIRTPEKTKG